MTLIEFVNIYSVVHSWIQTLCIAIAWTTACWWFCWRCTCYI